ncbi:MAG: toxin-antitoxin system HicB family antitoxin [Verrucomicrobiota bacterium]
MSEKSKAYMKVVEWSEEDKCYIGSAPPLIGQCCHGDTEEDVYRQLAVIVDEWIEIHESDGTPLPDASANKDYSGKFIVRVTPELHKAAAIRASLENQSLNAFVENALRTVTARKTA